MMLVTILELFTKGRVITMKRGGSFENMNKESFYLYSLDPLRYTQITTKHVVIKAPAIPDITHSAVSIAGKTAKSQGHNVW